MEFEKEKLAVKYCEQHCIEDNGLKNMATNAFCCGYGLGVKASLPVEVEQALEALEKLAVIYENDCEDPELGKPHWLRQALITCQHLRNKGE